MAHLPFLQFQFSFLIWHKKQKVSFPSVPMIQQKTTFFQGIMWLFSLNRGEEFFHLFFLGSHSFLVIMVLHLIPLLMHFGISLGIPHFLFISSGNCEQKGLRKDNFFLEKDFVVAPKVA